MADRAPSGVTMVTKPKPRAPLARATGRLTSTTLPWAENRSIISLCVVVAARLSTYNLVFMRACFLSLVDRSRVLKSLPKILRWVPQPVEPFGFKLVQNGLPPPLLDGDRHRLGQQPGVFDAVG